MSEPPAKRFRYESYSRQISHIKVDARKSKRLEWAEELDLDNDESQSITPLTTALSDLSLIHLCTPYASLTKDLIPLCRTLPLTLHNLRLLQALFHKFFASVDHTASSASSGLDGVLVLYENFFSTVLGEGITVIEEAVVALLRIGALNGLEVKLIEQTYSSLSSILKLISSSILADPKSSVLTRNLWNSFRIYLGKDQKPHVRSCVGEVWAVLLRRARGEAGKHLVGCMVGESDRLLEGGEDALAGVLSESMKGAPHLLHSRALPLYKVLIHHLLNPSMIPSLEPSSSALQIAKPSKSLLRTINLLTTSLIHHCSSSGMLPIHQHVLALIRLESFVQYGSDQRSALLSITGTLVGVRKGQRIPSGENGEMSVLQQYMIALNAFVPSLSSDVDMDAELEGREAGRGLRKEVIRVSAGCLIAGKLADWLRHGVRLIDELFKVLSLQERFAFVSTLVKVNWKGVEQFLLGHVAQDSVNSVSTNSLSTFSLLALLAENDYLDGGLSNIQGGRWKESLSKAIGNVLSGMSGRWGALVEAELRTLEKAFLVLPKLHASSSFFLPAVQNLLESILCQSPHDPEALKAEFQISPHSSARALGLGFSCLHDLRASSADGVDKAVREILGVVEVNTLMENWGWSRDVLNGIAGLVDAWATESSTSALVKLYPRLRPAIASEDDLLRLSALRILAHYQQPRFPAIDTSMGPTKQLNFFQRCLEAEEAGMSVHDVRDRTLKIRKVGLGLREVDIRGEEAEWILEAIIAYMLSQLKVNFRPLYKDTIAVLAEISNSHPELVWKLVFAELEKTATNDLTFLEIVNKPDWARDALGRLEREKKEDETLGKEFRCPNEEKLSTAVELSVDNTMAGGDDISLATQISGDRLDIANYEAQLLLLLGSMAPLAEKHSRQLVALFLLFAKPAVQEEETVTASLKLSLKAVHTKLVNFLTLFAKFTNPKAIYKTDEMYAVYERVLSKGDEKLQTIALSCVLTYKSGNLLPYQERLRGLLTEAKFRDELSKFSLGASSDVIDPVHRNELIPIVTRILYGIMTYRKGKTSSSQGPAARKDAILAAIAGFSVEEYGTLVGLMLESFKTFKDVGIPSEEFNLELDSTTTIPGKQQMGFLSLLGDVLKHLAPQTILFWPELLQTTMHLVDRAQRFITAEHSREADLEDDEEPVDSSATTVPARSIRTAGLKRLAEFFRAPVEFDFAPYIPAAFTSFISPRLELLDQENTQAPSATMEIFAAWAFNPTMVPFLVKYDSRVLPKLFDCLSASKVKPAVIVKVLDIAERLLSYADNEDAAGYTKIAVINPNVNHLLGGLAAMMATSSYRSSAGRDDLFKRQISVLARISSYVTDGEQAKKLIQMLLPLLRRPGKQISERVKTDILKALEPLFILTADFSDPKSTFYQHSYGSISSLFRSFHTRPARQGLSLLFGQFAIAQSSLQRICDMVADLNAFSTKRLEEPDFDRRLKAYAELNDNSHKALTLEEWLPLLHNLLFFVQDAEELSIRSNAAYGLRRFIQAVSVTKSCDYEGIFLNVVVPGLRNVLHSRHELVRGEALGVLASAIKTLPDIPFLQELEPLLASGDEEANFFNNIYHVQTHRRTRALRRLIDYASGGAIRENTLTTIFLPIVGHFITGAAENADHHLVNEAIIAVGKIAGELRWSKYHSAVLTYIRLGKIVNFNQKYHIRAVTAILDNFHFSMQETVPPEETDQDEGHQVAEAETVEANTALEDEGSSKLVDSDARDSGKIADYVISKLLPTLNQFIEQKDETEDSIRIPVALGVIKVALNLPEDAQAAEISRLLTILSQILRSKDQDTRDLVKDTMCKIAITLGPTWLSVIIKEMRAALQRGPQLHVLAVVTHAILVHVTTEASVRFSNLDEAIGDVVHVSAEVIWGQSGNDVVSEGFKTKMREVRGAMSRGYDSFQLVSRLVSPKKISLVLLPLRNILHETRSLKPMQQVDEALRRISSGLNANSQLGPVELLRLCHTLIGSNSQFLQPKKVAGPQEPQVAADDYRVQMKRKLEKENDHYTENAHKFVAFGLDLFVTAFRRGKFDFAEPEILGRMGPMVNIVGETLYSGSTLVLNLGLKASAALVKCPIPEVAKSMPIFISQILNVVRKSGGGESEVSQTALKSLAVIIRDCKTAEVKDKQLSYLLEVIGPDLEEPERQAAVFSLLRAIISRRFVVVEIYDLMERVSSIMVTSQSTHVQELCRSALMQFLLDYPQGKGRLKSQMTFLAQNLSYVYESGRISVMELLSAIISKFSDGLVADYSDLFFLALVIVLANDDAEKCRAMAGELIKQLIKRFDNDGLERLMVTLTSWSHKRLEEPALARSAIIVSGLLVQALEQDAAIYLPKIVTICNSALKVSAQSLAAAEEEITTSVFDQGPALDYALPYQALTTLLRCLEVSPDIADSIARSHILPLLLFPHDWVRLASARSLNLLLASSLSTAVQPGPIGKSSKGQPSALSDESLLDMARKSALILSGSGGKGERRSVASEKLCSQLVKLLFFVGRRWADAAIKKNLNSERQADVASDDENDEATEADPLIEAGSLPWLMSRLSFIARSLIINRPSGHEQIKSPIKWTPPLAAILRFFAAMTDHLVLSSSETTTDEDDNPSNPALERYLRHMLSPVYRLLDDEGDVRVTEGDSEMESLHVLAVEVREHIQAKAGMTAFSSVWEILRKAAVGRRGGRKRDRDGMALRDPEEFARRKEKRGEMKKENKKRKVRSYADAKQRERPVKRRV